MNKSDILHELRIGTKRSFDHFFSTHYASLLAYVDKFIQIQGAAEDIVSETFIAFWNARTSSNFTTEKDVESFLFTVAKNRCLNFLRDHKVHQKHLHRIGASIPATPENHPGLQLENREIIQILLQRINEEIDKLPEESAQVLRLRYIYGVGPARIAALLGLPLETVRNRSKYGLRMLKKRLGTITLYKNLNIP